MRLGAATFAIPVLLYVTSPTAVEGGSFNYPDDWLFRKAGNFRALFFGDWILDGSLIVAALIVLVIFWRHVNINIHRRVYFPLALTAIV